MPSGVYIRTKPSFRKGKKLGWTPKMAFKKGNVPSHKGGQLLKTSGDKAYQWKGDNVGYCALHKWVSKELGKPAVCEYCGTTTAKKFEWASKNHEYKRNLEDWVRLCTKCHKSYDNNKEYLYG